ncbi:hybrid sensor histidine kinase/response regulator [Pseudobutyrivibrio ruminis]|uniref:ATP-binding response regulator n=1 Tax=Pseudobutyrivibrio ruminis TaxID=46206 RepID=UPI000686562D|nr:ATP-binding protein [Pseudobutyrivibrio ruminis]
MEKTNRFVFQIIITCGLVLFAFVIALMVIGEHVLPDERTYSDFSLRDYSTGWQRVAPDGSLVDIHFPGEYQLTSKDTLVIQKEISDVFADRLFVTFSSEKQDVYAYIDDNPVYSYTTKETRLFGNNSPGALMFVPVKKADEGKTLRIEFVGNNNYTGVLDKVSIGTQLGIINDTFEKEKLSLFLSLLLLLLGFIAFVIGTMVKLSYNKTLPLFYAGWGGMCAGLWALAESPARQFIAPNFSLISYLTYISLIMIPLVMSMYFDRLQECRYRILYMISEVLVLFVAYIGIIQQLFNNTDLSETLIFSFIGILLSIGIFLITSICDYIQGYIKGFLPELIGIYGAVGAGIIQINAYRSHPTTIDRNIILLGLLFMIVMSYIRAFHNVRNMERDIYVAVQAQEASTAFLSRMSHEMRTPINAIMGMNKMILRESKEENILEYARDVNSAGNYLLSIVNEVLDLAKVNAGKIEIVNEDYELIDMVRECYALVRPRAKASRLAFEVDMSDVLPSVLRGDKERLIQVITNLLTNAVKYTPEGRITLSVKGKIFEGRLLLIVQVSDTGIGVAKENIPYLFDSFKRVGEFQHKRIEGTGLGLTITKQLVELMDGSISVESELGKGTTFTVVVPQEIRSIEPCGIFSMGPNGDRRIADRHEIFDLIGKILVVDDVAINLRVFSMLLSNTDITVDTAISGLEAIGKIKDEKYDIIFIDHLMPGMDGVDLKEILDSLEDNPNKDTPLIMQTANAVVGAKEEYERLGFDDYIEKPIKEEELRRLLRKYIL